MGCEESFITMKLIWHDYLVLSLDICVHETPIETKPVFDPNLPWLYISTLLLRGRRMIIEALN